MSIFEHIQMKSLILVTYVVKIFLEEVI
ncbi:unnamed protein product [Larinioides sclopetarius]|uniref:Ribosomal protein L16 n=1 Tax=Larinioides sclopetarius TaxID=280406 RepID=A0AAV2BU42_9ARAC